MNRCILACALVLAVFAAGVARAEGERPLPWDGGAAVETDAERLFGQAASEIAGRPVQVRCNGETDWAQLAAERGLPPGVTYGYVRFGADFTELAPVICSFLDHYAYTSPKPSYWCTSTTTVTEWVQKQKRVRVRKPLLKNGKPVRRKGKPVLVWTTRIVTTKVPQERQRTEPVKCEGADEWWWYSFSLLTLAHESYHLRGVRNEAETDCYGLQALARTAVRLGASEQEAKTAAEYARTGFYSGYWPAECRSGGALDLTPGDGVWP